MKIYDDNDPLVLNGTYDTEGYRPGERARIAKQNARRADEQRRCQHRFNSDSFCPKCGLVRPTSALERKTTMRFFDDDKVGCYLDDIGHRVEKTKDGGEVKMVDLTLRVQPFTPELAASLDPDVRALLFAMTDATPKPKIKALHFNITTARQSLDVYLLPESLEGIRFTDVEVTEPRARTEKGVDGFGLVFYASIGPVSAGDLEYICNWHTQQRFISFHPQEPALNFEGADPPAGEPEPARRIGRRRAAGGPPVQAGDELRPGVHAEH